MQLIRGLHNLSRFTHQACVLTIGNFDGVHIGHQDVLKRLVAKARELNVPAVVMTFEPSAREYFAKDKSSLPARLTRFREKFLAIQEAGVDAVVVVHFDDAFSRMTKESFVSKLLVKQLGVKAVMVGEDFKFGFQRAGDFTYLQEMSSALGYEAIAVLPHNMQDRRVSSTWVREALSKDDLATAEQLLGRAYAMRGRVVHGAKLGRQLGFPTANIYLHRAKTPVHGIYAVKVHGLSEKPLYGAANVGERPTVDGTTTLLEVYILDFNEEIYGKTVEVEFAHKIRDEERYDSLDALKIQIEKDVMAVKQFFATALST
jgi:riboflavin kinase / FMN adenylyltransferase